MSDGPAIGDVKGPGPEAILTFVVQEDSIESVGIFEWV